MYFKSGKTYMRIVEDSQTCRIKQVVYAIESFDDRTDPKEWEQVSIDVQKVRPREEADVLADMQKLTAELQRFQGCTDAYTYSDVLSMERIAQAIKDLYGELMVIRAREKIADGEFLS